jgi:hypothetical protein
VTKALADEVRKALVEHTKDSALLTAFDAAIAAELPRVSHVTYDAHDICEHFAAQVRKRLEGSR